MRTAGASALLRVEGLTRAFAGVRAVDDLSFTVATGSVTGLVGPNGSGKSTTIDCLSGFQRPQAGRWFLGGRELTRLPAHRLAAAGLVRTFQNVQAYDGLGVLDNLVEAALAPRARPLLPLWRRSRAARRAEAMARAEARDLLARVGLAAHAASPAGALSYGQRKLLAIAAAMIARPRLVVLDEPVAGVNPTMIQAIAAALRALNAAGTTLLVVEHNMDFIGALCGHVLVLRQGRLLAQGPPAAIRADPRVLEAYLGAGEGAPGHG